MLISKRLSWLKGFWPKMRTDDPADLLIWRDRFSRVIFTYGAIFLSLGMIYTLPGFITERRYGFVAFDAACLLFILSQVFVFRSPLKVRRYLLLILLYSMATVFIVFLGPFGARPAWLVMLTVFAGVLFGVRGAIASTLYNTAILWALYGLMGPGNKVWASVYAESIGNWIYFSLNTSLIALISGLAVSRLLNRLDRSLRDQLDAAAALRRRGEALETAFDLLQKEMEQRKVTEKSLIQSEARYRLLAENAMDVIWTTDMEFNVTYMSPSVYRTRGYTQQEAMALKLTDHLTPDSIALATQVLAEELAVEAQEGRDPKRSRTVELGFLHKDGSTFWGEVKVTFIRDSEGKAVGILGVSRDINDRRRAEEALQESEREAQRNAKEASAMAEIGRIMSSTLTIEEVYESFVAVAGKIIPFDRIVINMIDRENRTLGIVYISGGEVSDRKIGAVYSLEGSANAEMLRTKSTFLLQTEDFEKYKDRYPMLWSTFQAGFRSFLNVPLFSRGEIIGGLLLRSYKPHAYADEDVRLAERIANQIAGAIANAQLFVKEKQTQEALREAERKYRELVRYAPAAIYEGDFRTGRFISVNDALCEMIGYSREELLEMKALDILDEESQGRYRHRMAQWLDGKEPERQVEYRVKTKDGRTRDGVFNVTFKTDENGKPLSAAVVAHDITERKQMENALRESEERFRQVAENVGDFIWEVDAEGLYRYTSPSVERILGYKPDELIGKKYFYDLFVPEVRKELQTAAFNVFAEKQSFRAFPNPNVSKEGKVVHVETSGVPVLDAAGNLVGYRGADTDVTERKKAEEELRKYKEHLEGLVKERTGQMEVANEQLRTEVSERKRSEEKLKESEERFRLAFENANIGMCLVDLQGRLMKVNHQMCEIFGYSQKELENMTVNNIAYPEDMNPSPTFIQQAVSGEADYANFEKRYLHRQGHIVWGQVSSSLVRDAKGVPQYFIAHVRDITEHKQAEVDRKNLEARIQRMEKMEALGTLAGGVAHDLNNILSGVVGYPDLILMQLPEDSPLREAILAIQRSGQRAAAAVQDLLTLARRGVVSMETLNLNDVISDYLKTPEQEKVQGFHPGVRLEVDLEEGLLPVKGSRTHLSKTVMNLLSNATEAISDKGTVTLSTRNKYLDRPIKGYDVVKDGDYVVLTVSDSGKGISAEDRRRIFEPFYTKKVMGRSGTGLGLAVVWGTVKDHNGYIDVQSEEGRGTIFALYFPVTREPFTYDQPPPLLKDYMGEGETILVVDDVREQCKLAEDMLSKLNYEVTSVSSGEEAVEYLKTRQVDLLVLDMIMDPGIDGFETYRRILETHPGQKAIIVSGFSETERVRQAQELGAGAYIRKPYVLEKIGLAVRQELHSGIR